MIQNDDRSPTNLKSLWICFELLLDLKSNFLKREVMVMGASKEEKAGVENLLNYKVGSFPLTYPGFPITDRKLSLAIGDSLLALCFIMLTLGQGALFPRLLDWSLSSLPYQASKFTL
jgi:hypothetical protein